MTVEITTADHGRVWSSNRLVDTAIGSGVSEQPGLAVEVVQRSLDGVVRAEVVVRNAGTQPVRLESVTSLVAGGLAAPDDVDVLWAENDWLAECRWRSEPMRVTSPDRNGRIRDSRYKGAFIVAGHGVWSSCGRLPMGGLTERTTGRTWVWQIEHNGGGWRWECGVQDGAAYVALSGPEEYDHGWS
ncbi:MAG TPA: hypothetical protein VF821_00950, partial [Lentzea sp.]